LLLRETLLLAALAFLLRQVLDKKLEEKGSRLSAEAKRGVTTGSNRARQALNCLGISPFALL